MGTPEFAVPTLQQLIEATQHKVVAVFTQPSKSQGRGLKEMESPVYKIALQYDIPVYHPATLRSKEAVDLITSIEAEVIIVVAYGFLIPKVILESKKYGCLNIHPSSLPRHRGAAPLQHTIIAGDQTSAVCIIQMDEGFDTGDIILQHSFILPTRVTLPLLQAKCATIGANLLLNVLDNIAGLPRIVQSTENVTYAPKFKKEEGKIDWCDSAYKIDCKIRGMNPWPGVYFEYNGKIIKILEAEYDNIESQAEPGTVLNDKLFVACGEGILKITKLQQQGRKILYVDEFLRGENILPGTILS